MNKIILIFFLCVFSSSANAGLKEIGQGEVGTDIQNQIKNQYEKKIKKKRMKTKNLFSTFTVMVGIVTYGILHLQIF